MKGLELKSRVWKLSPSLSLISSRKQMRDSVWDESKSLALSLPLRVTRVIHLQFSIWSGSQTQPRTRPSLLPRRASPDQKVVFYPLPPPLTIPAVWCLVFSGSLCNGDQETAVRGQQTPFMNGVSHQFTRSATIRTRQINFRWPECQTLTRITE